MRIATVAGTTTGLDAANDSHVLNKTTWLNYGAIEEEPSVPSTNLIGGKVKGDNPVLPMFAIGDMCRLH